VSGNPAAANIFTPKGKNCSTASEVNDWFATNQNGISVELQSLCESNTTHVRCFEVIYTRQQNAMLSAGSTTVANVAIATGPALLGAPRSSVIKLICYIMYKIFFHSKTVVPNRGSAAPWGAIYSAQGCRGLTRFFTISLKIHFQAVIKPQSKLQWVRHYGCRKLLFFSVGCRKPKKVGKHCSKKSVF